MINYENYGKITLSKGTILYHWSSNETITDLTDNLFLCLDNSFWSNNNKTMYKYKVIKNIDLILTIQNKNIIDNNIFSSNNGYNFHDYELLTLFYNNIFGILYKKNDDVSLKTNKTNFTNFCNKLYENKIEGLFNYIDCNKGQFEIVIFKPNEYLNLIETVKYKNVKLHKLKDCKRIMLNKKINYIYKNVYNYEEKKTYLKCYPSIFYYIYKKRHLK